MTVPPLTRRHRSHRLASGRHTGKDVADALIMGWIKYFGPPRVFICDPGTENVCVRTYGEVIHLATDRDGVVNDQTARVRMMCDVTTQTGDGPEVPSPEEDADNDMMCHATTQTRAGSLVQSPDEDAGRSPSTQDNPDVPGSKPVLTPNPTEESSDMPTLLIENSDSDPDAIVSTMPSLTPSPDSAISTIDDDGTVLSTPPGDSANSTTDDDGTVFSTLLVTSCPWWHGIPSPG